MRTEQPDRKWRFGVGPGRILGLMTVLIFSIALVGCDDDVTCIDDDPPAVPTGVFTVTGDGVVSVYWNDVYDLDISGYGVYRHDGDDPEYGPYYPLGDVAWDENYDEQTLLHWFDDEDVVNGETYYYAVLSFDASGNESALSFETVIDTPRPAGIEVFLFDRNGPDAHLSGFDFSEWRAGGIVPYDNAGADIYVAYEDDVPFVYAARPDIVKLQDYGTIPLHLVDYAPDEGYSATGRAELIEGHSYIVKITEDPASEVNYAKFFVYDVQGTYVELDWAYQEDLFNPELKVLPEKEFGGARGDEIVRF